VLKSIISKLLNGRSLTEEEATRAMTEIMEGRATPVQIAGFITALRFKGETVEEITGCARVMRYKAESVVPRTNYFIDTCGTGGDGSNTFNVSTAVAIVAAAGGVAVAKHGNRSVSSSSGSADVLEVLGVNIQLAPEQVRQCIDDVNIGFMFAPAFHKSMKHAAAPRKELGFRSIFNILGPLTNPARPKGQLLGVYSPELISPVAHVLKNLGTLHAMVVHGNDGLDEITTTTSTRVTEVRRATVINYEINPEDFGIKPADIESLRGGNAAENAGIILSILKGCKGPCRDIVVINSAAALYVGGVANSIRQGIYMVTDILDSGKAYEKLEELRRYSSSFVRAGAI
jgi:anthranilate phosphoribosyltransferase